MDQVRETIGEPPSSVLVKVIDHLDDVCRDIISKTPFIVIASATSGGYPDISPKGDPAGFVQILDDKHLAIPDRPGNRRLDTFQNLIDNPYLAIIFIIPGKGETLRVTGEVRIVRDVALRESMEMNRRVPEYAIVMHVERVFIHCPKCIVRAKLWEPDSWGDASETANIAEAMIAHGKLNMTPDELEEHAEEEGMTKLY
jgi:PPOX class probable FMN-dependent enzyme